METLPRLSAGSSVDDVVAALDADGYAIVERLLEPDTTAAIRAELVRLLGDVPVGRNFFEGFHTRRLYAPFAKTRVLDDLALHPLVLGAVERVLGPCLLSGPTGILIDPARSRRYSIATRRSTPSRTRTPSSS